MQQFFDGVSELLAPGCNVSNEHVVIGDALQVKNEPQGVELGVEVCGFLALSRKEHAEQMKKTFGAPVSIGSTILSA